MSKQVPLPLVETAFCICITSSLSTRARSILAQLPTIGIHQPVHVEVKDLYFIQGRLAPQDLEQITALICDPVTESPQWRHLENRVASVNGNTVVEVAWRPGVTDNTAAQLLLAALQSGIHELQAVATGTRYEFKGLKDVAELHKIAQTFLVNDTVQRYTLGEIHPEFIHDLDVQMQPEVLPLCGLDDAGLLALSQDRRLALNLAEMRAIQAYFAQEDRAPTDAELETLAQTWSEHCVHKTFRALIRLEGGEEIDGLLRSTIQAATRAINAPWVRSAFVDNAGVIAFDDENDLSFKVETHNHPSAIEPFGGANTGVGGVVRDVLGVSHRPVAVTDVLCFGPRDLPYEELPQGVYHPRRIETGVVAGVGDYGNKLGLATVNGAVLYHPGYTANPLVYCGCVGIGPRGSHPNQPQPGDRVIVIGGRTGRDGLRGATFSSLTMDAQTGQVAGAAVQIGDPITEKGVIEVTTRARDAGLYHAITDCGAGGLSSAVGEMSAEMGVKVDLSRAPLKYAGLLPWEIWLSEAQERMVMAVPVENLPALDVLCQAYEVEWSDIGEFLPTGRLEVSYQDIPVVDLSEEFLHHGIPRLELYAAPHQTEAGQEEKGNTSAKAELSLAEILLGLLSHPNIASKEEIVRRYDHEVRGASIIKPLAGPGQDGPSDAAVLKPLETSGWRGYALANGINPLIGEVDSYAMAFSAVDEAIRNLVAVGGDPARVALLDNFCWGDPRRPETLFSLVRAAQGCHDAALYYQAPFISGKDSLNNEYITSDGQRQSIPGSLLISAITLVPDVRRAISMDLKEAGSSLYLVGDFQPSLAGSHALHLAGGSFFAGSPGLNQVPKRPEHAPQVYHLLYSSIQSGLVRSAHDLSEGGLGVAAAEMALAGGVGLQIDLSSLGTEPPLALFGETNGCLLVEVPASCEAEFQAVFGAERSARSNGGSSLPCRRIGKAIDEDRFSILQDRSTLLELTLNVLRTAFKTESSSNPQSPFNRR